MIFRYLVCFLLIVWCCACSERREQKNNNAKGTIDSIPEKIHAKIVRFSNRGSREMPKQNELIFLYSKVFDTTFLLQLKNEDRQISGVIYEILPSYHRDIYNFASEDNELLFFQGYSFKLSSSNWLQILSHTNELMNIEKDSGQTYGSCADCPEYYLMHDSKIVVNFGKKSANFKNFKQYLADSLLTRFRTLRKPVLFSTK